MPPTIVQTWTATAVGRASTTLVSVMVPMTATMELTKHFVEVRNNKEFHFYYLN